MVGCQTLQVDLLSPPQNSTLSHQLHNSHLEETHTKEDMHSMIREPQQDSKAARTRAANFRGKSLDGYYTVSLIAGDGIGPEISQPVQEIFAAAKVPIKWEPIDITPVFVDGTVSIPAPAINSIRRNGVALKDPLATSVGKGHVSLNLTLRRTFNLFANVRPCESIVGYRTPYENVDMLLIRENTEGEYSGIEHLVMDGVTQSVKLITRDASERVLRFAFRYADETGRKRLRVLHKGTIMKMSDGLFASTAAQY